MHESIPSAYAKANVFAQSGVAVVVSSVTLALDDATVQAGSDKAPPTLNLTPSFLLALIVPLTLTYGLGLASPSCPNIPANIPPHTPMI